MSINIVATVLATCCSAIITSGLPAISTSHALSLKPCTGLSWTKMAEEKQRLDQSNGQNRTVQLYLMLPCIVIDFFLNNQRDAPIIQILFCYKALHVSGIFSAHHQEFSTVHSALVSFMRGFLMTASKQSQYVSS